MRYPYRDLHTHHKATDPSVRASQVYSLSYDEMMAGPSCLDYDGPVSVGLHPWDVSPSYGEAIKAIEGWMGDCRVAFIGEAGLDRLRFSPFQQEAFMAQARLSERYSCPMILHVVRMIDDLLEIRKNMRPSQDWILHGFRGKPEQMRQILSHGIDISFGAGMNILSYRQCPAERRYLETDELDDIRKVESIAMS